MARPASKTSTARQPAALKSGDHVRWSTPQGPTEGTVVRRVTGTVHAKGHTAQASADAPQFKVESDASGKTAIHKPEALRKTRRKR